MDISILTIGDEILIGQIIDTNSAWIGEKVNEVGGKIVKIVSTSDDESTLEADLAYLVGISDLVLITGGLGPTKDDKTKQALARFLGVPLVFSETTYNEILRKFRHRNIPISEAHRNQCYLPAKAALLENKVGTAPGMMFQKEDTILISMPGVPYEMKYIMENSVLPHIQKLAGSFSIFHETILIAGMGESQIADALVSVEDNLPKGISIAYLPSLGVVRVRLTIQGESVNKVSLEPWVLKIETILADNLVGKGNYKLEQLLAKVCIEKNIKLGTAESCTGGLLAHKLTAQAGASAYFQGGIVAYSNAIKINELGVKAETIETFGAVSEETVTEMAKNALSVLGVDIAVAISGIAGPGGGTEEKPVGTIWIAVAQQDKLETTKLKLGKNRWKNIQYAANVSMYKLIKMLSGKHVASSLK